MHAVQGNGRRMYGVTCTMQKPLSPQQLSTVRLQIAARMMAEDEPLNDMPNVVYAPVTITLLTFYPFFSKLVPLLDCLCLRYCPDSIVTRELEKLVRFI